MADEEPEAAQVLRAAVRNLHQAETELGSISRPDIMISTAARLASATARATLGLGAGPVGDCSDPPRRSHGQRSAMTTPDPVTGATQDPRWTTIIEMVSPLPWSPHTDRAALAKVITDAIDVADAAAGIRRVTLDEAIERAAELDYDDLRVMRYGLGHAWADAPERVKESARKRVRRTITAGFGGAS